MTFSRNGDGGETSLLDGHRVPKHDLRPEAYGVLDEASAALGVARAMTPDDRIKGMLLEIQKDLLTVGAELACPQEALSLLKTRIGAGDTQRLEGILDGLLGEVTLKKAFVFPGETVVSAQIDVGRTIIRRAERQAARLKDAGLTRNPFLHAYLNRLADLLFVLARYAEANPARTEPNRD